MGSRTNPRRSLTNTLSLVYPERLEAFQHKTREVEKGKNKKKKVRLKLSKIGFSTLVIQWDYPR